MHILYKKNVQVSKAIAESSFQNAKNVFVKPLESLMSGFTSSLFQLTADLTIVFIEIIDSLWFAKQIRAKSGFV